MRNNQGLGKCNQPRPPTLADYPCLHLHYSQNLIQLLFIITIMGWLPHGPIANIVQYCGRKCSQKHFMSHHEPKNPICFPGFYSQWHIHRWQLGRRAINSLGTSMKMSCQVMVNRTLGAIESSCHQKDIGNYISSVS